MKLNEIINKYTEILESSNIENPNLDTELIISHFTGINRLELILHAKDELSDVIQNNLEKAIKRRLAHEPLQYILGETEFFGLPFKVNPDVLIPRPETELLVERIISENSSAKSILEIGTGSGCLAIALKKHLPKSKLTASDISEKALQIARKNATLNKTDITYIHSDLWENISERFDLIVSNPPYIPPNEFRELPAEIKNFEPENALLAQEDGIYFYRKILEKAKNFLTENGKIYFEIGYDQADRIRRIALKCGFSQLEVFQDLNGFDRMMRIE
jgi:release factor glutamine methyltransferase